MQLLINPVDRPNGKVFAEMHFELECNTEQEIINYAIYHSRFIYSCGKKQYITNHKVWNAIKFGRYRIIH